ncbi:MAG: pilus assembly FimT family protein [Marinicella sp.]
MNVKSRCFITSGYATGGFTLIEILLVVLIIGIMTAVGANLINSQSIERTILNRAQQFVTDVKYLCEKSVFENHAYGLEWLPNSYQVLRFESQLWQPVELQINAAIPEAITTELLINGLSQNIAAEAENLPHIVCQTDGSFNAFELRFSDASSHQITQQESSTFYAISSESPWQLTGAWHQQ